MTKILLTGSTGFLGNCIYDYLSKSTEIITVARSNADIEVDLSKEIPKLPNVNLVIHCAGKAHSIPKTELEILQFYDVNFGGTLNLLKALEKSTLPKHFVFMSSVAVYGQERGNNINEDNPLIAKDPYGLSKIEAEKLILNWCIDNKVICTILRLPLLVGKNPPGNLGAMVNAIKKGFYFNIGKGQAKKSMVLSKDVASLIPVVFSIGGIYNLTDGFHPSFYELSLAISKNKKKFFNLPLPVAKIIGKIGDVLGSGCPINSLKVSKMASDLTFDDSTARRLLNWNPESILEYLQREEL